MDSKLCTFRFVFVALPTYFVSLTIGRKLSLSVCVCVCVCVLTRVVQIITAKRRDMCNPAWESEIPNFRTPWSPCTISPGIFADIFPTVKINPPNFFPETKSKTAGHFTPKNSPEHFPVRKKNKSLQCKLYYVSCIFTCIIMYMISSFIEHI